MDAISLFDTGRPEPCPTPFNLAAYVLAQASCQPDKAALEILTEEGAEVWSYGKLEAAVLSTAGGLSALGLKPGARLLLRLGNSVEFPLLFLGAIAAGLVPVPSSAELTLPETESLLKDLSPALILCGAGIDLPPSLPCPVLGPEEIAHLQHHAPGSYVMDDPNRPAYIVYTSGTSGRPRGVIHAHRAVWARRMMWQGWYDLRADDRLLHAGAFNWTYTLGTGLMDPWAIGATALIPAPGVARGELARQLRTHRATIFAAAPGVYRQILQSGASLDLPDLRHGLCAGEKLSPALKSAWEQASGRPVYEALGMSEISTFVSAKPGETLPDGFLGRVQKGRRVAVLSEANHQPVALNSPGILAVSKRDPGLMLGYLNAPKETAEKFAGEWFLTGDVVAMDADGAIRFLGRGDDMMNAGGYRVSPLEVEAVLNSHTHISESAAIAVEIKPDTFVIAAFYLSDIELAQSELSEYCSKRLARYKCPRLFRRLDSLPKGANGKLGRAVLRAQFRAGGET